MTRLTPEEITEVHDAAPCVQKGRCPGGVCEQCEADAIQEALLSKLQKMKLEDLEAAIAREIGQHAENCPWEDCTFGEKQAARTSAKFILSLITPFLVAQTEAAEKAGMKKVLDWIAMHGLLGIYSADLQAFKKENGIEVKQ